MKKKRDHTIIGNRQGLWDLEEMYETIPGTMSKGDVFAWNGSKTRNPVCHRNGTITYWSVHYQSWETTCIVSDRELSAMSRKDKERVIRHMKKYGHLKK